MRLSLFAVKVMAMLTIKCTSGTEQMGAVPCVASVSYFLDRAQRVCGQALCAAGLAREMCLLAAWKCLLWAMVHAGCCSPSWLMVLILLPAFVKESTDVEESFSTAVTFGSREFTASAVSGVKKSWGHNPLS